MTQKVKLSELFKIGSSKRVLKAQWQTSGVPFYRGREITKLSQNGFVDNDLFISEELYAEYATKHGVPTAGDIVITAIGTIGNSYIVRGEDRFYFKDASVLWLKRTSDVESRYINLWLKSSLMREQLDEGNGATVDTLTIKKLQGLTLELPSIPEQKRIVALLDTAFADLEQTRAKTEQNLKNARELFDSYLQQVFSQKGEGWVDLPLGDICNFKHGFAFKSEFFVDKSKLILLTPGSFYEDGGYRDRGEKTKYYEGDFPAEYLLKKGDLLVAMTEQAVGLLGSSALVPENNTFLHNQRLGLVELTPEFKNKVSLKFLFHLFNTKNFRAKVQETATGLKVRHTSPKKMQVISVPILNDVTEQELIAQKLFEAKERVIELEAIYQQKLDSIDELKKSILQKAFSGELTHY